jgi:hypothetical protein
MATLGDQALLGNAPTWLLGGDNFQGENHGFLNGEFMEI